MGLVILGNSPRHVALSLVGVQALGRDHFPEMPQLGVGAGMREPLCPPLTPSRVLALPVRHTGPNSQGLPDLAERWSGWCLGRAAAQGQRL